MLPVPVNGLPIQALLTLMKMQNAQLKNRMATASPKQIHGRYAREKGQSSTWSKSATSKGPEQRVRSKPSGNQSRSNSQE
jgi:hypothetical protein